MARSHRQSKAKKRISVAVRVEGAKEPRIALFVEGAHYLVGGAQADPLRKLWECLCDQLGRVKPAVICGFNKSHILQLDEPVLKNAGITPTQVSPLDLQIKSEFDKEPFDRVVVAFDQTPENQLLPRPVCVRGELLFILENFVKNQRLPPAFHCAAKTLLSHYQQATLPRPRALQALEFVFMAPHFEALVVSDDIDLRRGLGFERRPHDWPFTTDFAHNNPKELFRKAVDCARKRPGGKRSRGDTKSVPHGDLKANPHGWAKQVIANAPKNARLFQQAIAQRLKTRLPSSSK
jgi:hypothetical protein